MANQSERLIEAVENTALDRPHPPLLSVAVWRRRELAAAAELARVVADARRQGSSWTQIAGALGVSKQAAWERFGPGT